MKKQDKARRYKTLKMECEECEGTGIRVGHLYPSGVGTPCGGCNGSGCREVKLPLFTHRRLRSGISIVRFQTISQREHDGQITYQEFLAGKQPRP